MSLSYEKKRINNYLSSDKSWAVIVDLQNKEDLSEIKDFFHIGNNKFLAADMFCSQDGTFKLDEFYNAITNNSGDTFVTGLSAFLKIQGSVYTKKVLKELLSKSISGHVIIVTYQCKDCLKFADSRYSERGQIIISKAESDIVPNICLISKELANAFSDSYDGIDKISLAIETANKTIVYIATSLNRHSFSDSLYSITQMSNGYDVLCDRDARTKAVPKKLGTSLQWNYALQLMGNNGDWTSIVIQCFGNVINLSRCITAFPQYNDEKKWIYYIALIIFEVSDNKYLQLAVQLSENYSELIKSIYRALLSVDHSNATFESLYFQRKEILKGLSNNHSDVLDYCKVVSVKGKESIFYLTDISQPEKERIIEWLDSYGLNYSIDELIGILTRVYPDLSAYLSPYRYKNTFLDSYFSEYKYQKVINKILPSFEAIVEEQSTRFDFMELLCSRTSIVDKIDVSDSHAYFFDALGIEYLSFIQEKCNQYDLTPNITCSRCELPSLTSFNKEFVPTFEDKGCSVSDIKELDEIKHHGENSFDFEKVKTPIYLISELQIIDSLLKKIKANIDHGFYRKAIIVSDHGASRLAVLHNTENVWNMATKGVHSGRCCPKSDIDSKPDFAIEAEDFWVLANYDRFKGGRKANCEVHGGATLEEVAVPIIEITKKLSGIEAFILDSSKTLTLKAKEHAVIMIYVALKSNNISIKLDGKYYDAESTNENYIYSVDLVDYSKKGVYSFDILNGSVVLSQSQTFEIKKKGMSENNLFG